MLWAYTTTTTTGHDMLKEFTNRLITHAHTNSENTTVTPKLTSIITVTTPKLTSNITITKIPFIEWTSSSTVMEEKLFNDTVILNETPIHRIERYTGGM